MIGPVVAKERIAVLDIIRGFALFGVLLVNMVMINKLVMEFNTDMDVLFSYALIGFLLLGFREMELSRLRVWAVSLMILSFVLVAGSIYFLFAVTTFANVTIEGMAPVEVAAMQAAFEADLNHTRTVYTQGSYWQVVWYRLLNEFPLVMINAVALIPRILGLFLIGLYVGKLGVFRRINEHLPLIRKAMFLGGAVGAVLSAGHIALQLGWLTASLTPAISATAAVLLREVSTPFLSLFYVTGIILLWQRGALSWLFAGLAALGRMALTNYLVQCIALAWLFYGHGLGLMGINIVYIPLMTIGIYIAQIVISRWWLSRYSQGPAEWVWRRLTYGQLGMIRSDQTSAGA